MNHFELFEIPVSFIVDKSLLAQKYFALQKKYHPDFFTTATAMEQEEALEISAQINKGFKVLKNEDETIKYLLQIKEMLKEDEKYQLPSSFLMEVMEMNEELTANTEELINTLTEYIHAPVKTILQNYSAATTPDELLKIKEYYYKKKYLQRILDRTAG